MADLLKDSLILKRLRELFPDDTMGIGDALYKISPDLTKDGKVQLVRQGPATASGAPAVQYVDPYQLLYNHPNPALATNNGTGTGTGGGGGGGTNFLNTAISGAGAYGQVKNAFNTDGGKKAQEAANAQQYLTQDPEALKKLLDPKTSPLSASQVKSLSLTAQQQLDDLNKKAIRSVQSYTSLEKSITQQNDRLLSQAKSADQALRLLENKSTRFQSQLEDLTTQKSFLEGRINDSVFLPQTEATRELYSQLHSVNSQILEAQDGIDNIKLQIDQQRTTGADALLQRQQNQENLARAKQGVEDDLDELAGQRDLTEESANALDRKTVRAFRDKEIIDTTRSKFLKSAGIFGGGVVGELFSWKDGIFADGGGKKAAGIIGALASYGALVGGLKGMSEALLQKGAWKLPTFLGGDFTKGILGWMGDSQHAWHAGVSAGAIAGAMALLAWLMRKKTTPDEEALAEANIETEFNLSNPSGVMAFLPGVAVAMMGIHLTGASAFTNEIQVVSNPIEMKRTLSQFSTATGSTVNEDNITSNLFVKQDKDAKKTTLVWVDKVGSSLKINKQVFDGLFNVTSPTDGKPYAAVLTTDPKTGQRVRSTTFTARMNAARKQLEGSSGASTPIAQEMVGSAGTQSHEDTTVH